MSIVYTDIAAKSFVAGYKLVAAKINIFSVSPSYSNYLIINRTRSRRHSFRISVATVIITYFYIAIIRS